MTRYACATVATFCMFTASAAAIPPMVVSATPANGAQDVDPDLRQITIEFDQDMNTGGHSCCGGGENYPKVLGQPRFAGKRKFVMNVRLEPDHEYSFSVNCPSFQNFRGANGEPARIYPVSFRTAARTAGDTTAQGPEAEQKLTPSDNEAAIAVLRDSIDNWYSYRDRLGLDWDALFEEYTPLLTEAKTPMRFAAVAGAMLAKAEDKHIWLVVDGETVPSYVRAMTPNANADLLPRIVPNWQQVGPGIFAGQFEDGITYLRIDEWSRNTPVGAYLSIFHALARRDGSPRLIIDVRFNGGGDESLAQIVAGFFVDQPVVYAQHVYRDPSQPGGFSDVSQRVLQPVSIGEPGRYPGNVAVLSGPVVMSSCEAFVLMMKQAPDCVIIGASTQGASGNPRPYDLGNGVTAVLPSWKSMTPDGGEFEGVGIEPDVKIDTQPADFTDADPVLDAALEHLRNR